MRLFTLNTGGTTLPVQNSNGADSAPRRAIPSWSCDNADGTVSLGCDPAEYTATVVSQASWSSMQRGTCARVARAIYAQKAGAAAAAMIDTSTGYSALRRTDHVQSRTPASSTR